jgi:serine/threonine-protein kinase RIO1
LLKRVSLARACLAATGDYRFRGGYSKHNPRKMVKAWAEKEFRNLCAAASPVHTSPERTTDF